MPEQGQQGRQGRRAGPRPKTPTASVAEFAQLVGALADTWSDRLWDAGRDDLSSGLRWLADLASQAEGNERGEDS